MLKRALTPEYARGLIEGDAAFLFTRGKRSGIPNAKIPTFQLKMDARNKELLEGVRGYMRIKGNLYTYNHPGKDGANRNPYALFIVREIGNLKNQVIPFLYDKLAGEKGKEMTSWLEKIGSDPEVPESYKILYRLHSGGYYAKNARFID